MSDDLRLAIASALHPRLGAESPLGSLPVDLVRAICELVCVRDILSPMELPLPVLMYPLDASLMYTNLNANGRSRLRFRLTYETSFQYEASVRTAVDGTRLCRNISEIPRKGCVAKG